MELSLPIFALVLKLNGPEVSEEKGSYALLF